MNLLIIITSTIILLLIIFFTWNVFYENYTDLLNSGKNLLINDINGNMSKYSVDSFTSVINNDIQKLKTDIFELNKLVDSYGTALPEDLNTQFNTMKYTVDMMFPQSHFEFRLYNPTDITIYRRIIPKNLGVINNLNLFYLYNVPNKRYIYLNSATEFKIISSIPSGSLTSGRFVLKII